MVNQRSKFLVGLFMAGGVLIMLIALIWLGMNKYFEQGNYYASYFDQSVQGLSVDSPVKYRGVTVGRVDQIGVAPDSRLIMVIMMIDANIQLEQDMIAQLAVVGITGSMFIELDRASKAELSLSPQLSFPSKYPIVPSKPSEISEIFKGLDDVIRQFNEVDLPGISDRAKLALDNINKTITDFEMKKVSEEFQLALENFNTTFDPKRWDSIIAKIDNAAVSLDDTLKDAKISFNTASGVLVSTQDVINENRSELKLAVVDFRDALNNANNFFNNATHLVQRTDGSIADLSDQLNETLVNLATASSSLNRTLDQLAANPSQLLFGEPPPPRQLGGQQQ